MKLQSKNKVNMNVISGLARLLAAENLTVVHNPKIRTAMFQPESRILTLPILADMTSEIYKWFVMHESAHAIWTKINVHDHSKKMGEVPFVFINVTEDARIEKLIKKKFPGTIKYAYNFYKEMSSEEKDFFGIKERFEKEGKTIEDYTLIDRINLHFKLRGLKTVPFNKEEMQFVKMVDDQVTFDDAVNSAIAIYEYMKKTGEVQEIDYKDLKQAGGSEQQDQQDKQQKSGGKDKMTVVKNAPTKKQKKKGDKEKDKEDDGDEGTNSVSKEDKGDSKGNGKGDQDGSKDIEKNGGENGDEKSEKEDGKEESQDGGEEGQDSASGDEGEDGGTDAGGHSGDNESSSGDDNSESDSGEEGETETEESENQSNKVIPKDSGCTQTSFDKMFEQQYIEKIANSSNTYYGQVSKLDNYKSYFSKVLEPKHDYSPEPYEEFMKEITPTISMLVNYFNMKKKAKDYHKSSIAKTGKVNPDKLAEYQFNHDIFLRSETVFDSKNHGMVMVIDWSGSMSSFLRETLKQLIVLVEFCKKSQIPFEVYGFTDTYNYHHKNPAPGEMSASLNLKVFKLVSSDMNKHEYKRQISHIYQKVCGGITRRTQDPSAIHNMSGTPICSVAQISENIINDFKKKFNREKTIFVFLSDGGETDTVSFHGQGSASRQSLGQAILNDKNTGENIIHEFDKHGSIWHSIFKHVKQTCDVTKMIGFYLTKNITETDMRCVVPMQSKRLDVQATQQLFNQQKYIEFGEDVAFDKYYMVDISNFNVDMNDTLNINPFDNDKKKGKKIQEYLTSNTKNLLFLKKFIEAIS